MMAFLDETYLARKARMLELMSAALRDAPVVRHDLSSSGPSGGGEKDRAFWLGLMRSIAGRPARGITSGGKAASP